MTDKAKDLQSLRIDRSSPTEAPWRPGPVLLGLIVFVLAGLGAFLLGNIGLFQQTKPALAVAASTSAPPPAAPSFAPAGSLVASGYIVARRVATVSAEITGRITDVLVEEGMVVKQGQILARLDSSLVDQDLPLARAQIISNQADLARFPVS